MSLVVPILPRQKERGRTARQDPLLTVITIRKKEKMEQLQLFEGQYLVWRLDRIEQNELLKALERFQTRFNGKALAGIYCQKEQVALLQTQLQLPEGLSFEGRPTIQPNHIWLRR